MAKLSKKEEALLASLGIKLTNEDFIRPIEEEDHTKDMVYHQAQSLLINLKWPYAEMVSVECWNPECKRLFLTNYSANVYCSMTCLKVELEKKGIVWRPERSFAEQWGNLEPPLMIPPEAIEAMRRLLSIIDSGNPVKSHNQEQDYEGVHRNQIVIETDVSLDPPILYNDPDIQQEQPEDSEEDPDSFLALLASQDE